MQRFTGIMPALLTPLKEDESLNVTALRQLMDRLLQEGADGFYLGGATGEGLALRREVREELAAEAISFVSGRKPCIVHVASVDYAEMLALARQAEASGAAAISAVPPLFFAYGEDDVYHYYKRLAEAVHIPVMVYYNPAVNFRISAEFAARLFEIDNVTAIKWTNPDYFSMMRLKQLTNGEINIINGPDEMLLMGLNAGAEGGIGSTYNLMLPRIRAIYEHFMAGEIEEARQAQMEADRIIAALLRHGNIIPTLKALLEHQGFAMGNAAFPMRRYSAEEREALWQEVLAAGL